MKAQGKKWVTRAIKALAFTLIFVLLFLAVQDVLQYESECMPERFASYQQEEANSVDVLFLGSSPVFTNIVPMILWEEEGFTSVNLGDSVNTAPLIYYTLKFALKNQSPKLVVLDFCSLTDGKTADERELPYRKAIGAMPDWEVKSEMIRMVAEDNENQDPLGYYLPLLRFHDRWNELTEADFVTEYQEYQKGNALYTKVAPIQYNTKAFEMGITEEAAVSEYSWGYYQKILELCREKGCRVAAVSYPVEVDTSLVRQYNTIGRICEEYDLSYYNFNTPEIWEEFGIDQETDFYNGGHMNLRGGIRLSEHIAGILAEDYSLPDHREDPAYAGWQENWQEFSADYRELLEEFGY